MTARPAVGASVDLGSNSVHLLVASIAGHVLRPLDDESVFLGLGAAIDSTGHLGPAVRARLVEALEGYAGTARRLGARSTLFLGTEPIRRAADAPRIVDEIGRATGVPLHVLTHEEEAYLTLIGVTEGRPVTRETLVLDIGGGSSEFCAVGPRNEVRAAGLRIGSNRLTSRVDPPDPPTPASIAEMRQVADAVIADALADRPRAIVAVGGTVSNLLKVTAAGPTDRSVTRDRLDEALTTLMARPAAATSERYGVNPTRARILPAGAVIVDAVLRHYRLDHLTVSEAGIREGAILAADHAGRGWRDELPALVHGWRT